MCDNGWIPLLTSRSHRDPGVGERVSVTMVGFHVSPPIVAEIQVWEKECVTMAGFHLSPPIVSEIQVWEKE